MPAQTGVVAAPMTYTAGGSQYIAVLAGWGGAYSLATGELSFKSGRITNVSRMLAFRLGGTASLGPVPAALAQPVLNPPASKADAQTIAHGKVVFSRYCGVCHGDAAVSGGLVPDLRASAYLGSDEWFDIVLGGKLKAGGMASFAGALTRDDVAAIREYVIARANEDKQAAGATPASLQR